MAIVNPGIEVCLTPHLFINRFINEKSIVVIVDILRATTSMITAFQFGVDKILPVAEIKKARDYKDKGWIVAAERNGVKLDFADFGNSPFEFMIGDIKGKSIIYSSTNGTQALEKASNEDVIALGAFINLKALAEWIILQNKNVVIFCSGWKNTISLEDTIFAGALSKYLLENNNFETSFDSTQIAMDLWKMAKPDLKSFIKKASHYERLKKLDAIDIMDYALTLNTTNAIPVLEGNYLINISK